MTDLVLVNPNGSNPAPFSSREPPLWLGLIAGYRQSQGKDVRIVDAEAQGWDVAKTVYEVVGLNPKEVMIVVAGANPSVSSTPKMPVTIELLKYLPDAKITGIHPIATNYPNTIKKPFSGLPGVPWSLLPMDMYRAHNWHCLDDVDNRSPYGVLYTSLNCSFSCFYCNIHTLYGDRKIRYRDMEDIFKDLRYFAKHGIRNIKIWDELFCLDEKRVMKVCDYIIAEGFAFNIWAYARVDTVTPAMLVKMKKAGINWLAYGFESANNMVRVQNNKRYPGTDVYKAISMTRDAGINIMGNFIFGLPGDTMDSMKDNLDMAIRENFEYVNFYVALPYPGSEWYESLKDKPIYWSSFSQFSTNICASPEVMKFRDYAFQTYFNRPEYLSMIKGKFGFKAENHIKDMLNWKFR